MVKGCPKFPYKICSLKGRGFLLLRRAWVGWSFVVGGFVDGGFGFIGGIIKVYWVEQVIKR
ncbi:hypothetical protein [Oceanirhabdus seepicola]|uniref:Transmembrane protein n=1 Tax=Oceanirhabdus seepicola TaxID=2828781 RepID=A0A9J6P587_9CLOT|nr:hypothetical protein [Oceanirhabdus seepicola]MCM1991318.1 hypothetical protein [Oceanirhabdus seepicola]